MNQRTIDFAAVPRPKPKARAVEIGSTGTSRFGGRLKPEEYSTDWGIPARYDKIRRMMNDADVGAAIDQIIMPLEAAPWEVVPGDESAEAAESAAIIQRDLIDNPPVYSWEYVLEHALQAPVWGSMLFEPVWAIEEGKVRLQKLAPRMPHTIQDYYADDAGLLNYVRQYTNTERGVVEIPAEKLVAIVYRMEGSDYTGRSLLRRAYKPWWMKAQLEDIDGISAEKHGMGVDVVNYDPDATDSEDLAALKAAMRALHVHQMQNLTIPNGMTYDIKAPSGTVHDVKGSIKHHQQMIFRALLADMLGMGEGRLGSHGLSEDKTSVLMLKLVKLGKAITEPLNVQLIAPWHRWNYGEDVPAPYIKHGRIDTRDLQGFVEAVSRGVEAGVLTPNKEVESMVRDIGGLMPIDDAEREQIQSKRIVVAQGAGYQETQRVQNKPAPDAVDALPAAGDIQKTALNGAQVQSAQAIVQSVAYGQLPRDAGIGMLVQFFNMTNEDAEAVMGTVGRSFEPTQDPSAGREGQSANAPLPFAGRGPQDRAKVAASLPRPRR